MGSRIRGHRRDIQLIEREKGKRLDRNRDRKEVRSYYEKYRWENKSK